MAFTITQIRLDIDECETGDDNCDLSNGYCNNTIGSFDCFCNVGYTGDGITCTSKLLWLPLEGGDKLSVF